MPAVLGGEDGAAGSGSGDVLPAAADGVFRRTGLGARDGVAGGGLAGAAEFSADRAGGSAAGSLDGLADAAADRRGDAPGSVHVGAGSDCGEGIAARQDAGNRRHDAGGQRSTAKHRAAGQPGKVTRSFSPSWRRSRASRRRRGKKWRDWTGSGRRRVPIRIGSTRTIPTRGSRR